MTDRQGAASSEIAIVGIVGAGVMGCGIAQVALEAGHEVVLHDVDDSALGRAQDRIADGLAKRASRVVADPAEIDAWVAERAGGLRTSDVLEQLGDEVDAVIETALESLELKQTIFRTLAAVAAPSVILATNTSALSIASIASATSHPERVLGLHFFNPAPLMRLVEVIPGPATDPRVADAGERLVTGWGKVAVRSADAPGFIVNRVNRPFTLEALRILEAGQASVETIDAAMRDAGFPLGPFELMDLTGIDVTFAASTAIWEGLGHPDRLRPSPIQEARIAAGALGRKTGEGFYRYLDGKRGTPAVGAPTDHGIEAAAIRKRILAAIDAEAGLLASEHVASEADIDRAMRLGANHPQGPFERARHPK
ncbi:MAG TPA: 3-hydroxyacyl-CoA dehydrogenase NAD-binding domain-containing protein [Candidatus Limnocylindrales bacterium]